MLYLGIDQHRKQLTACIRDEKGDIVMRRQVSTQWDRVRSFLTEVRQLAGDRGFVTILEVCGFNDWLIKLLDEYGCRDLILVQPDQRSKKKTDRRDANALCELLWVNRERLPGGRRVQGIRRIQLPTAEDAEARQLTELRKLLGQFRTKTINKIKHILRKHNLEQQCPTKGLDTIKARKWLGQFALGRMDRLEMDLLLARWKLEDEQIDRLDAEIGERQKNCKTAAIVASIPGCGAYSSLTLAARIGSIDRFPHPGSLANYWGLTPGCRNSGDVTDRLGSITKQGSATARFILGQMVMHVLRHDAWMKAWYGRIKKRRGSKIARVAVMRRLATIIWHMLKHKEPYVAGGPPRGKLRIQAA
jgi:transposase